VIDTSRWVWEPWNGKQAGEVFWIGIDADGRKWLVKMRGGFYALRERAFARLAHLVGVLTQESAFVVLSSTSPPIVQSPGKEPYQVALKLMAPHAGGPCAEGCPLESFLNDLESVPDPAGMLAASGLPGATGWVKADFLADMFGANESSERFLTSSHECTLVDNEQHFAVRSTWTGDSPWLRRQDGSPSEIAENLLLDLSADVAALTSDNLAALVAVPKGFTASALWPLLPVLRRGVEVAALISRNGRSGLRELQNREV